MNSFKDSYRVGIVGGGPAGLFLAILLQQAGIECVVLEKRKKPITHSRSLGIHPVSLELMEQAGIVDDFLNEGVKIEKGIAFGDNGEIGSISFASCPGPYRFVLSLPQFKTEALLENHLQKLKPEGLIRGAELTGMKANDESVQLTVQYNDQTRTIYCDAVAGCDGKDSFVRQSAGLEFEGTSYPDTYVMGDFSDNTIFESKAAVFLSRDGLIESFPLGDDRRRWVVKTDTFIDNPRRIDLEKRVAERIGHDLGEEQNYMLNSFGVQKYIAKPMAKGRVFLTGDAAHVVSPIGGQGMNLGWLDCHELAKVFIAAFAENADLFTLAKRYSIKRTKAAGKAIRRAELNMALGKKTKIPAFKNAVVWLMLNTPLKRWMARQFTMRGLE